MGGNTPLTGTGKWSIKSGPGTVIFSDSSVGNATAAVSAVGTYVFTWTIMSGQCTSSSADVTVVYNVTDAPTGTSNQSFCKLGNPKVSDLVAVGNNLEWFAAAVGGSAITSNTNLVTGSYFAEQTDAITSCKSISRLQVDVIIDNPRVAMFNIKALAIIETLSLEIDKENMMPSVGILDDYRYNMVPGQVDVKNEFYEGIILSLTSKESSLRVSVMVDYKPLNDEQAVRQY